MEPINPDDFSHCERLFHIKSYIRYDIRAFHKRALYRGVAHLTSRNAITNQATPMAETPHNPQEPAREFFIQGITSDGKQFRPSDWAERLCGVMSCFRPEGYGGPNAHLQYSPYVRPTMLNGVRSVVVNAALREIEPLAYHFVVNFAKDNDLQVVEACLLPEAGAKKS